MLYVNEVKCPNLFHLKENREKGKRRTGNREQGKRGIGVKGKRGTN